MFPYLAVAADNGGGELIAAMFAIIIFTLGVYWVIFRIGLRLLRYVFRYVTAPQDQDSNPPKF